MSQSTVSRWKSGALKAKTHEVRPLLEEFGHKLRRRTSRLYQIQDEADSRIRYVRIEGPMILDEAIDRPPSPINAPARDPARRRLVVHHRGAGRFTIIEQNRIELDGKLMRRGDDGADWMSVVYEPVSASDLVTFVEEYAKALPKEAAADARRLPFQVRKALLDHGFPVDGVVVHRASW